VPTVLREQVYAVAALAGATVLVASARLGISRRTAMSLGFVACFALRVVTAWQNWNLPKLTG
jgi:uncharacterized membrane protein YeiH